MIGVEALRDRDACGVVAHDVHDWTWLTFAKTEVL